MYFRIKQIMHIKKFARESLPLHRGGKHVRCFGNIISMIYIKFLVYRYVLSLRIQVNQSLSRFSLSE